MSLSQVEIIYMSKLNLGTFERNSSSTAGPPAVVEPVL